MLRMNVVVGLSIGLFVPAALAQTWWPWNGHEYTLVTTESYWQEAQDNAEESLTVDPNRPAYLVCINSADEEAFLRTQFGVSAHGCWTGGYQDHTAPDYSEPAGGWRWVSGESFGPYTNWNVGEPNNQGSEDFITWGCDGGVSWWNDQYDGPRISIVERALAQTWCSWNGHEYMLVTTQYYWGEAQDNAEENLTADPNRPAYLVCINSADEEAFLRTQFCESAHGAWIGGYQDHTAPDYSEPAGGWRWVSGESFGPYTNWNVGEPNNQGSEDFITWGCDGGVSWWNDQYDGPRISIVERVQPACDLCHGSDCDHTCLMVNGLTVSPRDAVPGELVQVMLDYEISGTPGHIIYVGLAMGDQCLGAFYGEAPGPEGESGTSTVTFAAPAGGCHPLAIAVAHVYDYADFCESVLAGEADELPIGSLSVFAAEEFPGPNLPTDWQSIGDGVWQWGAESGGVAQQVHGPDDDNCSVFKYIGTSFADFDLVVRWRQDDGPGISSGIKLAFRMGDQPGPGANVAGIGPFYSVMSIHGSPNLCLAYAEGFYEFQPGRYWTAGEDILACATHVPHALGEWRRFRVVAMGHSLTVYEDMDSSNPELDTDADFVKVLQVVDGRLMAGAIAFDDHYANSSWDYVELRPLCDRGDLDGDGLVSFADINPFVLRLTSPDGYMAAYPACDPLNGDINADGQVNFGDINPFVTLLTGG